MVRSFQMRLEPRHTSRVSCHTVKDRCTDDKQMTSGRINRGALCDVLLTLPLESGRVSAKIRLPLKHFCHPRILIQTEGQTQNCMRHVSVRMGRHVVQCLSFYPLRIGKYFLQAASLTRTCLSTSCLGMKRIDLFRSTHPVQVLLKSVLAHGLTSEQECVIAAAHETLSLEDNEARSGLVQVISCCHAGPACTNDDHFRVWAPLCRFFLCDRATHGNSRVRQDVRTRGTGNLLGAATIHDH